MMEHDDTSRATNDPQSIPTWLAQADPVAPVTATKPPRKSKRWLVFVGLPLVLTASYFAVTFISSRSNSCFDAGNYEALTALVNSVDDDTSSLSDLQSQEAFYTHAIYFQQATTASNQSARTTKPTMRLRQLPFTSLPAMLIQRNLR